MTHSATDQGLPSARSAVSSGRRERVAADLLGQQLAWWTIFFNGMTHSDTQLCECLRRQTFSLTHDRANTVFFVL